MVQTNYAKTAASRSHSAPGIIAPADPLFVAPDKGDFRLQAGSPAIGKGKRRHRSRRLRRQAARHRLRRALPPHRLRPRPLRPRRASPRPAPKPSRGSPCAGARPCRPRRQERGRRADDVSAKEAFDGGQGARHGRGVECVPRELSARLPRRSRACLPQEARRGSRPAPAAARCRDRRRRAAPADCRPIGSERRSSRAAQPAVARGGEFMGFPEKFNRYYTDPAWKPSQDRVRQPGRRRRRRHAATRRWRSRTRSRPRAPAP